MSAISTLLDWFAGGRDRYMTLVHCMNHDWLWIATTVVLDLTIASGYVLIALHWRRNEHSLKESPAKSALRNLKQIFLFCGLCGYLFIPIKMFWPAWRLYDGFLAILAYYTWRYALGSWDLRFVYNELGRSQRLAEDLEESRTESKRRRLFLNAVSHDLRTPLNGLLLQAELAELNLSGNDQVATREALEEIKQCVRTASHVLNRFVELGRLELDDETPRQFDIDLSTLLDDQAALIIARAEAKGLKVIRPVQERCTVRSDRVKIEQILGNLLDNALKFTDKGGIELRSDVTSVAVEIQVADSGIGIAAEHQEQIFDDFFQVKNSERDSTKGFGLGLPISRRLARQLGGDLVVRSEPGLGCRFILKLPRSVLVNRAAGPGGEHQRSAHAHQTATPVS